MVGSDFRIAPVCDTEAEYNVVAGWWSFPRTMHPVKMTVDGKHRHLIGCVVATGNAIRPGRQEYPKEIGKCLLIAPETNPTTASSREEHTIHDVAQGRWRWRMNPW